MSYELVEFEQALQKKYSSEIKVQHYSPIQRIVDYYSFTLEEIWKFVRGPILFGPKTAFLKNFPNFNGSLWNMESFLEDGYKSFSYFYCVTERGEVYVMLFRSQHEVTYLKGIRRLEKLRMFL